MLNALARPHVIRPIFRRSVLIPTLVIGAHVIALPSLAQDALLPVNPDIVHGNISITQQNPTVLQIDQSTEHGIINWDGFSIGAGHQVTFDNGAGATLNRVTGNNLSEINGALNATGSVYLINQNGVVFGETGIVRTGQDFVVSTLNVADSDFLNGGDTVFAGDTAGFILNLGEISSLGGDVALISKTVRNRGLITAETGSVGLIAGRDVLMRDGSLNEGKFLVRLGGADTEVEEAGIIRAAAAELRANGGNIYALAGNTQGSIQANAVAKSGGRVFLTAGKNGAVKLHKKLAAKAGRAGGKVLVTGGTIDATSLIDASGLEAGGLAVLYAQADARFSGEILTFGDRKDGNGGFIEVSGRLQLRFEGQVDTGGGTLLLDPQNVEIAQDFAGESSPSLQNASVVTPGVITNALATGNVVIHTTGDAEDAGTIAVTEQLRFDSIHDLTLLAHGDILVDADVRNSNPTGGDVNLVAGWDGETGGSGFLQDVINDVEFDITEFEGLELADQTAFGVATGASYTVFGSGGRTASASGSVLIKTRDFESSTQIASRSGTTRVYANNIDMRGDGFDDGESGYYGTYDAPSQIGFLSGPFDNSFDVIGDIDVRATGNIGIEAGGFASHAQIGHVGPQDSEFGQSNEGSVIANALGDVSVVALGSVSLVAGAPEAYAMIGHGSAPGTQSEATGLRQGDILVNAATVSLSNGFASEGGQAPLAWIGHDTPTENGISNSDLSVQASSFNAGGTSTSLLRTDILNAAWQAGSVSYRIGGDVELSEALSTDTDNDLLIQSTLGGVELSANSQIVNTGAGDIVLAGADLVEFNSDFVNALTATDGRWLVYSNAPNASDGHAGLTGRDAIEFGAAFNDATSGGNVLAYAVSPELIYTARDQNLTYANGLNSTAVDLEIQVDEESVDTTDYDFILSGFNSTAAFGDEVTFSSSNIANAGTYEDGLVVNLPQGDSPATGLTLTTVEGDLVISQRVLTLDLTGGFAKIYDGNTDASSSDVEFFEGSGPVRVDEVTASVTGTYEDKNVGTQKSVSDLTGTLTGADAGNYRAVISFDGESGFVGSISARPLALDVSPQDKEYDGTTEVTFEVTDDRIEGDEITPSISAEFDDPNVGEDIAVNIFSVDIIGSDAANYDITTTTGETADITARELTLTATAQDKIYDGGTDAVVNIFVDEIDGDDVGVTGLGAFETKDVGTDKVVNVTQIALSGTDASNYSAPSSAQSSADISERLLTLTITGQDRIFDGSTDVNLIVSDDRIENDDITAAATGAFEDSAPGQDKPITVTDVSITGPDAANYQATTPNNFAQASISPAQTREATRPQPQIDERAPLPVEVPSFVEPGFGVYSDVATDALVRDLTTASEFCRQIGESEYVIDCLGDRLAEIAKRLPANGAYAESREALAAAAQKLDALVRENASNALPPLRVATRSLSGGGSQNRVLRAVDAANVAAVTEQAVAILQEAETLLLRSAESSQRRRVHYQRIATAVGSNKLLLRST